MRWTGVPQTGHGFPNRPCTAIPLRKAVTFSGNPAPVSASNGRATSQRPDRERMNGCASSAPSSGRQPHRRHPGRVQDLIEYALPIPLKRCGSVSARLMVWFSRGRAAMKRRHRLHDLEPARVLRGPRLLTTHDMERRLALRARLGEISIPSGNERREAHLAELAALNFLPAKAAGDQSSGSRRTDRRPSAHTIRLPSRRSPAMPVGR